MLHLVRLMMTERMRTATEVAQPIHLLVLGDLPTRCWMGWDTARNLQQGDTSVGTWKWNLGPLEKWSEDKCSASCISSEHLSMDREMVRKMEQVRKTWATGSDTGNTCRDTWHHCKYKYPDC